MDIPSPAFVLDLARIRANCRILAGLRERTGVRIVHALKAFAIPQAFGVMRDHLDGCCASGPWEARLAAEFFGGAILTCSPAYTPEDIEELLPMTTHLDFNSIGQWERFGGRVRANPRFRAGDVHCGLRINPRCSTGSTPLYDPCGPGSRLGTPRELLDGADLEGLSGLHFHTLCEQDAPDLATTLDAVDAHFGDLLQRDQFRWLNMGGGHWITQETYDRDLLARLVDGVRARYRLDEVWLEPGEAAVVHSGELHAGVLDTFRNDGVQVAILDVSATAHMPDVLEMPYRPEVAMADGTLAGEAGRTPHTVRLGGSTCLAGDVIGDYAFPRPLAPGDRLVFRDMAQYTLVKTTMFNGVPHPAIVLRHEDDTLETVREFGYADFRRRYVAGE